jgi:hypothetical protein
VLFAARTSPASELAGFVAIIKGVTKKHELMKVFVKSMLF